MQKIHPNYHDDAEVTCTCGNTFKTGSTKDKITVEICSNCHPFFTGEMKFIDTMGRVEKFQKQQAHAKTLKKSAKTKKASTKKQQVRPGTLKEMLLREKRKLKKH